MKFVVLRTAKRDLADARRWYDAQRPGLGSELVEAVERSFLRIAENPRIYPEVSSGVRRARVARFPYGVFYLYLIEPEAVRVIAVLHHARSPERWRSRADREAR